MFKRLGVIESKVKAAGVASAAVAVLIAILNELNEKPDLLGQLPPWVQFVVITLGPPLVTVLAAYRTEHTPRPDLPAGPDAHLLAVVAPTVIRKPADILGIALALGRNYFNVGIGRATGHTDYSLATVAGGYSASPGFETVGDEVVFQAPANAKTTSDKTKYGRAELRETNQDGSLASWDGRKGAHQMSGRSRVLYAPAKRPWICFTQIHDAKSDLVRFQTESDGNGGLKLVARNTPPGSKTEKVTTIRPSYRFGDPINWAWYISGGQGYLYVDGVRVLSFPAGEAGLYFKAGDYNQFNTSQVAAAEYGRVALSNLFVRHSPSVFPPPTPADVPPVVVPDPPPVVVDPAPPVKPVPPADPPPVVTPAKPPVVMIIRHGEKPAGSVKGYTSPAGTTVDSHSLTLQGWARAAALVGLFAPAAAASLRPGLFRPTRIIAADGPEAGERMKQTVAALAAALHITPILSYDKGKEKDLAKYLKTLKAGDVALVCWEHGNIPAIPKNLGAVAPKAPKEWPDDRFDVVWVLVGDGKGGWVFSQVPELVVAGDKATTIK